MLSHWSTQSFPTWFKVILQDHWPATARLPSIKDFRLTKGLNYWEYIPEVKQTHTHTHTHTLLRLNTHTHTHTHIHTHTHTLSYGLKAGHWNKPEIKGVLQRCGKITQIMCYIHGFMRISQAQHTNIRGQKVICCWKLACTLWYVKHLLWLISMRWQ